MIIIDLQNRWFWRVLNMNDLSFIHGLFLFQQISRVSIDSLWKTVVPSSLTNLKAKSPVNYASSVSLYEVYKLTLRDVDKTVADMRMEAIKKDFTIIDVDPDIAEEAARISHRLRTPMTDSLIMATAKSLQVVCVTDDPHFTEVKRVWV